MVLKAKQHLSNSIIISNVLLRSYISCLWMSDSGQDCEKHNRCFSRCIFSSLSFLSRCLWHQVCSSLCPAAPRKAPSMVVSCPTRWSSQPPINRETGFSNVLMCHPPLLHYTADWVLSSLCTVSPVSLALRFSWEAKYRMELKAVSVKIQTMLKFTSAESLGYC